MKTWKTLKVSSRNVRLFWCWWPVEKYVTYCLQESIVPSPNNTICLMKKIFDRNGWIELTIGIWSTGSSEILWQRTRSLWSSIRRLFYSESLLWVITVLIWGVSGNQQMTQFRRSSENASIWLICYGRFVANLNFSYI